MRSRAVYVLQIVSLAAVYIASGWLGLLMVPVSGFATLVWVPSGVSLAALLMLGYRLWPGVALGAFVVNVWFDAPSPVAAGIAIGSTLEALSATYALRRGAQLHDSLDRVRDVVALTGVVCASATIGATVGVTSLRLGGLVSVDGVAKTWLSWWWGDFAGDLLIAPLLLTWFARPTVNVIGKRPGSVEVAALAMALVVVCALVFYPTVSGELEAFTRPYFMFPLLIWAACRFGPRGAATTNFVVSAVAVSSTVLGLGPFVRTVLFEGLLASQTFVAISAVATLVLGAMVVERGRAAQLARESALHKVAIMDSALEAIVTIDHRGAIREFNESAERLFGRSSHEVIGKQLEPLLVPPALREDYRHRLEEILRRQGHRVRARVKVRALRSDGSEFPAEIAVTNVAIDGQPVFTGFIRDLSAEEDAQQRLQRSHDHLAESVLASTADLRQANHDLQRREEQLREAQALASLGSFEWDIARDRLTGSDEFYRIYELDRGIPIDYATLFERIHPDDRARVRAVIEKGRDHGQAFGFEQRIVVSDGSVRDLRSQAKVEVDAEGRSVRMVGTCQDVTGQRRAEEARSRLAAIVESSEDAIIGKTPEGVIVSWNRGAEQMYGYSADEAIGLPSEVVVPDEQRAAHDRLLERVRRGERLPPLETIRKRKDGTVFDASVSMSPIVDVSGRSIGISTITRDVTEYTKAMMKFRRFVESAPDAMIIADGSGKIVLANAQTEHLFGYGHVELEGRPVDTLVPERLRAQHIAQRTACVNEPKSRPMGAELELFGVRKDGSEFPVEIRLAPIETEEGILVSEAVRDISYRKSVESQLKDSLQEKDILLREVHHRVKNNLQVIASLLDLQAGALASDETGNAFEDSQNRIQSIALVHQLLYQSKELRDIELQDYLRRLTTWLLDSYGVAAGRVSVSVSAPNLRLDIDTLVPCGLIVNELVSNSLKHAFPGGRRGHIAVSLTRGPGQRIVLEVKDDGIGISEVDLDAVRTLGLQVVRTLTKQLHGSVEIIRDGGTRFRITFEFSPAVTRHESLGT